MYGNIQSTELYSTVPYEGQNYLCRFIYEKLLVEAWWRAFMWLIT